MLGVVTLLCAATGPAAAQIQSRVSAEGIIEIFNDGPSLPSLARPQVLRPVPNNTWAAWIAEHAASQGVDARLVQAVMQAESGYNSRAVSRRGALGLMQLMPGTARQLSVAEPFDPEQNIRGGVTYLRQMLDEFGSVDLALAAYNAGPGAVRRHRGVPPFAETRAYVRRVLSLYRGGGVGAPLIGLALAGGTPQPHALTRGAVPSPLQRALARGAVSGAPPVEERSMLAAAPPAAPPAAQTTAVAAVAPAVATPTAAVATPVALPVSSSTPASDAPAVASGV